MASVLSPVVLDADDASDDGRPAHAAGAARAGPADAYAAAAAPVHVEHDVGYRPVYARHAAARDFGLGAASVIVGVVLVIVRAVLIWLLLLAIVWVATRCGFLLALGISVAIAVSGFDAPLWRCILRT